MQVFGASGAPKYFNMEFLLPDHNEFKKWNTNIGGVNIEEGFIQAFSHWTYDISGDF